MKIFQAKNLFLKNKNSFKKKNIPSSKICLKNKFFLLLNFKQKKIFLNKNFLFEDFKQFL